jgi:hypothetical protein
VRGGLLAALLCIPPIGVWPGMALGASHLAGTLQAGTLQAGTPQAGTPQAGTPQTATPQTATPQDGAPQTATPQDGAPQTATPQDGAPQTATPQDGAPQTATPQDGALQAGAPQDGTAPVSTTGADTRSALVVFLSPGQTLSGRSEGDTIERELASAPELSIGILSATQGAYTTPQMVLDITQGARVSGSAYDPSASPPLQLLGVAPQAAAGSPGADAGAAGMRQGATGRNPSTTVRVSPWASVLRRADSAPQLLEPGSLATHVPGGGAYVPAGGVASVGGVIAADRTGHVASAWLGPAGTLPSIERLRATHRLVVADLPTGPQGYADLRALATARPAGELLIAIQRTPDDPNAATFDQAGDELLWIALAGIGPGGRTLSSQTTNQRGMVAAIDIAPTILDHLGLPIPAAMRGRPIRTDGPLDSEGLRALKSRLGVLASRRLPAVAWLIVAWALLLATTCLPFGAAERARRPSIAGAREPSARAAPPAAGRRARVAWALRVGGLALLWTPVAALVPAALEPSRATEFVLLVALCFALGALTDRLVPWPRAPIIPAVAAVLTLSVDALAGTQLLIRSLLGPNPEFGARFYGIGNELKSALAVLVFSAVAAAIYPAVRSRRAAATMACAGILLAIAEGSARIGAGVGGVILVSASAAVASVMLLPGTLNRERVLLMMAAPIAGLVVLAALDLATAHGGGHFTGSVLQARSAGDIRDIIARRYGAAWDELKNHLMPVATALALLASVVAVRRRDRVLAPIDSDPAWLAALAGGLTAGVIGALTEDSGPVLLVVAVFVLGCVLSYLWGQPDSRRAAQTTSRKGFSMRTEPIS